MYRCAGRSASLRIWIDGKYLLVPLSRMERIHRETHTTIQMEVEGKEISMHSSRVWECESRRRVWECEWNMQANREKSALLHVHEAHTAYFWPLTHANGKISHIFFGQICIRLSMYVISLFGFFRALRCAFNGKWKWIMEHGIASCHRSRRRDWQKNF